MWPSRLLPRELQEGLLYCVDASTRSADLNLNLMVGERRRLAEDRVPWVRPRTQQSVFKAESGTVCTPRTQVGGSGLRPGRPPQAMGLQLACALHGTTECSLLGHVARSRSVSSQGPPCTHLLAVPLGHWGCRQPLLVGGQPKLGVLLLTQVPSSVLSLSPAQGSALLSGEGMKASLPHTHISCFLGLLSLREGSGRWP